MAEPASGWEARAKEEGDESIRLAMDVVARRMVMAEVAEEKATAAGEGTVSGKSTVAEDQSTTAVEDLPTTVEGLLAAGDSTAVAQVEVMRRQRRMDRGSHDLHSGLSQVVSQHRHHRIGSDLSPRRWHHSKRVEGIVDAPSDRGTDD